jgi:GTP-binding protein
MNPPIIVVHGNSLQHISDSYRRYLEGYFQETFKLKGTPLRVQFKSGRNPFASE